MNRFALMILVVLTAMTCYAQVNKSDDFSDFTKSPTEHQIVVVEKPFSVRSITGTITFLEHPGEPLAEVLFEVEGPSSSKAIRKATTDKLGRFKIAHLPEGTYKFKATRNGFSSVEGWIEVSDRADKETRIAIQMGIGS